MDIRALLADNTFLLLTLIWTLPWKGFALWKSSRNEEKWWFVAILLTNTFALLDVLYIFYFSKKKERSKKERNEKKGKAKAKITKGGSPGTSKKVTRKKA